jgi:hypothetical protein
MDDVQKVSSCINVPSLESLRNYSLKCAQKFYRKNITSFPYSVI